MRATLIAALVLGLASAEASAVSPDVVGRWDLRVSVTSCRFNGRPCHGSGAVRQTWAITRHRVVVHAPGGVQSIEIHPKFGGWGGQFSTPVISCVGDPRKLTGTGRLTLSIWVVGDYLEAHVDEVGRARCPGERHANTVRAELRFHGHRL